MRVIEITHLGQLTPDPKNARRHTPRNVGTIVDALNEVGAARSIVIDENGVVLAGNATIDAAAQAGIERVQVVEADGETIIAVRRTGLTDKQKKRLALFDNRAAELAEWELPVLLEEPDLLAGMFRDDEIDRLLAQTGEPVDPNELWQGMPEFEQDDLQGHLVHIHCVSKEDQERLLSQLGLPYTKKGGAISLWWPERPENTKSQNARGFRYSSES